MWFDVGAVTSQGQVREHNEDHVLAGRFLKNAGSMALEFAADDDFTATYGLLFAVADGVGGSAAGEVASRLALLTLDQEFYAATKSGSESAVEILRESIYNANATLLQVAASKTPLHGMGTTLSGICLLPAGFWTFHAGDSRVYRYRDGLLKLLTRDDTVAGRALRDGSLSFEAAAASPDSHVLTNCLGQENFTLALEPGPALRQGDMLLLCTDGLYDMVDDDRIAALLRGGEDAGHGGLRQAQTLLAAADHAGSQDNVSVIVIRVQHAPR